MLLLLIHPNLPGSVIDRETRLDVGNKNIKLQTSICRFGFQMAANRYQILFMGIDEGHPITDPLILIQGSSDLAFEIILSLRIPLICLIGPGCLNSNIFRIAGRGIKA